MNVSISHIEARSLVDGPGERTVLFMQGCPIRCPGCQNAHLWDINAGSVIRTSAVVTALSMLAKKTGNVTISGGEPFMQPLALLEIVRGLRSNGVANIIVYTGYTWETLMSPINPVLFVVEDILDYVNILVDGSYHPESDNDMVNWRGSSNQRPIDVQPSLLHPKTPVVLNWDMPVVTITSDGNIVSPLGMANPLSGLGKISTNRMCGQTR